MNFGKLLPLPYNEFVLGGMGLVDRFSIRNRYINSMEKMQFQPNDIVRLSKKMFEILSRELFFPQNLFVVKDINIGEDSILLNNINQKFSLEDIRPVRIDGEEDRDIYYDPIVAASLIDIGEEIPVVHRDTSEYYMEALKRSYNEYHESYYDEIHYIGAKYVHEIQNKIPLLRYDLKIHYHIMEFMNKSNVLGRLGKIEKVLTVKEYNDTFIKKTIEDEETIVYLKKDIDGRTQIASLYNKQDFDYVIVCSKIEMAKYYVFYINSAIGKQFLLPDIKNNKFRGRTKISHLKRLPIYYIEEYSSGCIVLQSLIDFLLSYSRNVDSIDNDVFSTILNYFASLRDSMVLEMVLPKLFEKADISILKPWEEEMIRLAAKNLDSSKTKVKEGLDILSTLFNDLMTSGNELMENMNRLRLYMKDFMDFATKKMSEEK